LLDFKATYRGQGTKLKRILLALLFIASTACSIGKGGGGHGDRDHSGDDTPPAVKPEDSSADQTPQDAGSNSEDAPVIVSAVAIADPSGEQNIVIEALVKDPQGKDDLADGLILGDSGGGSKTIAKFDLASASDGDAYEIRVPWYAFNNVEPIVAKESPQADRIVRVSFSDKAGHTSVMQIPVAFKCKVLAYGSPDAIANGECVNRQINRYHCGAVFRSASVLIPAGTNNVSANGKSGTIFVGYENHGVCRDGKIERVLTLQSLSRYGSCANYCADLSLSCNEIKQFNWAPYPLGDPIEVYNVDYQGAVAGVVDGHLGTNDSKIVRYGLPSCGHSIPTAAVDVGGGKMFTASGPIHCNCREP
jgi:hypothetical protein